jgi:hypothetical protein
MANCNKKLKNIAKSDVLQSIEFENDKKMNKFKLELTFFRTRIYDTRTK